MVLLFIPTFALLLFSILAAPANGDRDDPIRVPHSDPFRFTSRGSYLDRSTPLGLARGVADPDGALRFAVKYGIAARWQPSSVVTVWSLPYVQIYLGELKHTDLIQ